MIYFGGCSITMGAGFELVQNDPRIYANIVASRCAMAAINGAEGGSSNLKIFTAAAKALMDQRASIYVIQWSAPHRHWVYPMPNQGVYIGSIIESNEHADFVRQYQFLNHDYPNLMSVIDYCRILQDMAEAKDVDMIFVNGMLNWKKNWNDSYMQGLLHGLQEQEKLDFIERFENNLELLDLDRWANIYNPITELQIDTAPMDNHPGPNTHNTIADMISHRLDTL